MLRWMGAALSQFSVKVGTRPTGQRPPNLKGDYDVVDTCDSFTRPKFSFLSVSRSYDAQQLRSTSASGDVLRIRT
jgi:hypothetical protein